jgi:hypothetical protein
MKPCPECGQPSRLHYCSGACKVRAHRRRRREQAAAVEKLKPATVSPAMLEAMGVDARNVAALEGLWQLWRDRDAPGLASALEVAPELVRERFLKDRAKGYASS